MLREQGTRQPQQSEDPRRSQQENAPSQPLPEEHVVNPRRTCHNYVRDPTIINLGIARANELNQKVGIPNGKSACTRNHSQRAFKYGRLMEIGGDSYQNRIKLGQSSQIGRADTNSKLCPIPTKTFDLHSLWLLGSCLKGQWHKTIKGRYDNLLSLLQIEVQLVALLALTQYYDSPLRCFTFKDFQLAPTLEEYERLLGLPLAKSPTYLPEDIIHPGP
ncbi:hypothetical protein CR513_52975, partial [Mucuna pruriens]